MNRTTLRTPSRTSLLLLLAAAGGLLSLLPARSEAQAPFFGLSSARSQIFGEAAEQGFSPAAGDHFGWSVVAGDFNGDGADELAAGIPHDACNEATPNCGAVMLRWGFPGYGLTSSVLFLSQSTPGSPDPAEAEDYLGRSLAAGDFNGDGRDDLAIGQPRFNNSDPGGAEIHYGLSGGIQSVAEHFLRPGANGLPPSGENAYSFAHVLATGDFNGDGHDDLAIGFPYDKDEVEGTLHEGGSVLVANGGAGGLFPFDGYRISQADGGIPDEPEDGDRFGATLAVSDFNGDDFDDLTIGIPREDGVGAILVLFGSPNGLIFANHEFLGQFDLGEPGEPDDDFGLALAAGDFDGDGFDDLAIGAPGEDLGSTPIVDSGMITLLYGSAQHFDFTRTRHVTQRTIYGFPPVVNEAGDRFGASLAAGDFDGDGADDLVVGHPGESFVGPDMGAVSVLLGATGQGLFSRYRMLASGGSGVPGSTT
ncbi:MAG: FG-GAP-like repeat-containing protein, partial [Thermoanaerobaculia bacterium]|nr:FG-GAP-like repeat-containing protein [Thermoanaerobaculia bacterium]